MPFNDDETILYDPNSPDLTPETLPLEAIMARFVSDGHRALRIAFPGAIVAVDGDQTVDIQPLLMVRYAGQDPSEMHPIKGVPVVMPQGNDWRVSYPLATGDMGLVLVTDRSLDAWLAGQGGITDPNDTRVHNLADAVFIPGLVPSMKQTVDTQGDLVLANGAASIRLQKNGHIKFANASQEIVSLLHDTTQAFIDTLKNLQAAQTLTAFGPAPFLQTTIGAFLKTQQKLDQLLQNLDSFKS